MSRKSNKRVRSKRKNSASYERLKRYFRRISIISGALAFLGWVFLWLWFGGVFHKAASWSTQQFYEKTAQAGFSIKDIVIEGQKQTDVDIISALLNVEAGDSIFLVDPKSTKESLERISWVKDAHIERRFPDTIYIKINERVPVALWQNKGKLRLIDQDGVTIADSDLEQFSNLIVVVGKDAPKKLKELMRYIIDEPKLENTVEAASLVSNRRWDLLLKNGVTVRLPETGLESAFSRLVESFEEDRLLDKSLTVIDIRNEDRIIVRTKPGEVQTYKSQFLSGNDI